MDGGKLTSNFLILWIVLLGVGCTPQCEKNQFEPANPLNSPHLEFQIEDLESGTGPALQEGDTIEFYYRGWIYDESRRDKKGTIVGDNYSQPAPQKVRFGKEELIAGWQEGLQGIQAGSKRRLFIPATMAYGDEGAGASIPKGAHLIYEVEVVSISPGSRGSSSSDK